MDIRERSDNAFDSPTHSGTIVRENYNRVIVVVVVEYIPKVIVRNAALDKNRGLFRLRRPNCRGNGSIVCHILVHDYCQNFSLFGLVLF